MQATKTVLNALSHSRGFQIDWVDMKIGFPALKANGSTISDTVITAAKETDGVLLGPVSHNAYPPISEGELNPSGVLRRELQLYANIRPALSLEALQNPISKPIDLVIYRENLEGFYADRNMASGGSEFMAVDGVALSMRKITAQGSERIARAAFEGASPDCVGNGGREGEGARPLRRHGSQHLLLLTTLAARGALDGRAAEPAQARRGMLQARRT